MWNQIKNEYDEYLISNILNLNNRIDNKHVEWIYK